MSSRDHRHIEMLAEQAKEQDPVFRAQICAMLTVKNKPVSFGFNQNKTHPLAAKFSKHEEAVYIHAEIHSIINALRANKDCRFDCATMYVSRVLQSGEWGMAKPCDGCMKALKAYGISRVVYSVAETGKFEEMIL